VATKKKMHEILEARLEKEGWPNIKQFHDRSGVAGAWSHDTTRRVFQEHPKQPEPLTVAIVCRYLGMSRQAIAALLREHMAGARNTENLLWLIGADQDGDLTMAESAALAAIRQIMEARPELSSNLADQLDLLGTAAGVDVQAQTKKLRRRHK
jgi:hypothetical protein